MSSPNHSTSDIEDAFSSMNIFNYTSVSSDYFPASSGSNSFNSSENSTDNMIPSTTFSSFYNKPCLKDVQALYAKESPISSPDPITSPAILTPSPIIKLQKKQLGQKDKIAFAYYRISDLEQIIEKIQALTPDQERSLDVPLPAS
ncbi:hypothetical protein Tco_1162663 [Tanacetum coccineum]